MPLIPHDSATAVEMFPGVVRRTLTAGDRMMLVEVTLEEGAVVLEASGRARVTVSLTAPSPRR